MKSLLASRYIFAALLWITSFNVLFAQDSTTHGGTASITGTVVDPAGRAYENAAVAIKTDTQSMVAKTTSDGTGRFLVRNLSAGNYTIEVSARGFALATREVKVSGEQPTDVTIPLSIGAVSEAITVDANTSDSVAAQLAPMDALLDAHSARTEVNPSFVQNFASPVADFSELLQMAPGTYSVNSNGVGLGDSKTFFRGFSDGNYDIDFDGVPFYDTNDPTHHSWAFFPSPWIGSIDFDRSPGSAATTGPTPFGGSIHLLSHDYSPIQTFRGSVSYGSFNTLLVDGSYDSGAFGPNKKSYIFADVHRMTSDGYQTNNNQMRNAGSIKYQYKFSETNVLSGYSGVLWLDSNTPNAKGPTRAQVAQFGDNFLLSSDPTSPLFYGFYTYHIPTDVEYVSWKRDFGKGWHIDVKPYTLSYYNAQYYNNSATTISATSAVDKLNSYRKYGETSTVSQVSRWGVFRTGMWYEWAKTNRYQYPSDPRTRVDTALGNFHEMFFTTSYQPFAEYELHATHRLTLTAGFKFAHFNQDLTQFADNGKTVGNLGGLPSISHSAGYNAYMPSVSANYHLWNNWSIYGEFSEGTKIPPSSVFDVTNGNVSILPKPTGVKTYQAGTVLKLKRLTLNTDAYYSHFQNAYSSSPDPGNPSAVQYTASGNSFSRGIETEANVYLVSGLSLYFNGTLGRARYASDGLPNKGLWVANTPSNTEAYGLTYQQKYFDVGLFHKRVGPMWNDNTATNGATLNQVIPIDPFNVTNLFFNYTIRKGSKLDATKFRFSVNNLFDNHNITSITQATKGPAFVVAPGDTLGMMPGRSVSVTMTLGFSPQGR